MRSSLGLLHTLYTGTGLKELKELWLPTVCLLHTSRRLVETYLGSKLAHCPFFHISLTKVNHLAKTNTSSGEPCQEKWKENKSWANNSPYHCQRDNSHFSKMLKAKIRFKCVLETMGREGIGKIEKKMLSMTFSQR